MENARLKWRFQWENQVEYSWMVSTISRCTSQLLTGRKLIGDKEWLFSMFLNLARSSKLKKVWKCMLVSSSNMIYISGGFSISMLLGGTPDPWTITIGSTLKNDKWLGWFCWKPVILLSSNSSKVNSWGFVYMFLDWLNLGGYCFVDFIDMCRRTCGGARNKKQFFLQISIGALNVLGLPAWFPQHSWKPVAVSTLRHLI